MKTFYYNLAGGINLSATKIELGLDTKKLFWSDSKNIEIFQNNGITRQNGNVKLFELNNTDAIIAIHPIKSSSNALIVATASGKLYVYTFKNGSLKELSITIDGSAKLCFADFIDGVLVISQKDSLFYIKNNESYEIIDCNLKDNAGNYITGKSVYSYKGRAWVASGSTLYYSALGKYDDFTTEDDAGYIRNFYTDAKEITALKAYKDYLAIYKENCVYLLSGTSPEDFAIMPFADKGTASNKGVVNVNNKQYFINEGVFCLEQSGLLSQIQLGEDLTFAIKPEFINFDRTRFDEIITLHYEKKNQVWFFIPYRYKNYFNIIWIYDYINQAWLKRVLPQDITYATIVDGDVLTSDLEGRVYKEDFGASFDGTAIAFMWKSPFLSAGDSNIKKNIEEFYLILDEYCDNNFNFSVYKDYDSLLRSDNDKIILSNTQNLVWDSGDIEGDLNYLWTNEDDNTELDNTSAIWAVGTESFYKAEISESNFAVQLCIEGDSILQNAAIIGLEFKEIYFEE